MPPAALARPAAVVPGGAASPRRHWLSLPFVFFLAPYPPQPALAERSSPAGKGETKVIFMQGASPLASPGLNPGGTCSPCRCGTGGAASPRRHWLALPLWCRRGSEPRRHWLALPLWCRRGDEPPAALARPAAVVPEGRRAPGGTGCPCRCGARRGSEPPAALARPAFSLPSCPLSPPAPFPGGEEGDFYFISPGATAPGTPALNRLRHLQNLPSRCHAQRGARGSPQKRQKLFPMSNAGSQGEGGPGERNFGV